MRTVKISIYFFLVVFLLLISSTNETHAGSFEKQYFVTFNKSIDENYIKSKGGEVLRVFESSPSILVSATQNEINDIKNNKEIIAKVELDEEVAASGINFDLGNIDIDPKEQLVPWNVDYVNTLPVHKMGISGRDVKIGIIDSGITNHKDLKVIDGINIIDNNFNFNDEYGHGTKVAGVIGALDNEFGLIGVAPNAELYAIKVLDSRGKGSISDVVAGLEYAIEKKLDIVNLSLQTSIDNSVLESTLKRAYKNNILIIAAAGNNGGSIKENTITYPAAYNEVISVGAVNQHGERYKLSSTGKKLDLTAPGEYVYTTVLDNMYFLYNGTSMAAPHVTGVAALLLESDHKLKPQKIKNILLKSATPLGNQKLYGQGLVNAEYSVKMIQKVEY